METSSDDQIEWDYRYELRAHRVGRRYPNKDILCRRIKYREHGYLTVVPDGWFKLDVVVSGTDFDEPQTVPTGQCWWGWEHKNDGVAPYVGKG